MKTLLSLIFFPLMIHAAELKSDSIYNVDAKWTDQNGKTVELKSFQGHPVVLAMVYMSCPFLCPTITSDIQRIEKQLPDKVKNDVRFVLVSFDPDRDTPEKMRDFMKKHKLDPKRWTLMTNKSQSTLRELAGTLNFKFQKEKDGEFTHSYMITALDRDGVVGVKVEAANQDSQAMIDFLKK